MGSLAGHVAGFLLLFPIGIRRLVSSYNHHLHSQPPHSSAEPWYFSSTPNRHLTLLNNIDIYALLVILPITAFSELILSLILPTTSNRLSLSHQSAILSIFWLLLLSLTLLTLPNDLAFLLTSLAFLSDLLLSETPTSAIQSRAHSHLGFLTSVSAISSLAMAAKGKHNHPAVAEDVGLSAAIAMKGIWTLQIGVLESVWGPCGGGECELEEDRVRGVELVDTVFLGSVVVVVGVCLGLFAVAARGHRTATDAGEITRPMMTAEIEG